MEACREAEQSFSLMGTELLEGRKKCVKLTKTEEWRATLIGLGATLTIKKDSRAVFVSKIPSQPQ